MITLAVGACTDRCDGVVCGPTPPALQVVVTDTITIDTQLVVLSGNPVVSDTVDTVLVVRRQTTQALVTLWRVRGTDTALVDTVPPDATSYTIATVAELPVDSFLVRAQRDLRRTQTQALGVRAVGGCCEYSVVGFYQLALPQQ